MKKIIIYLGVSIALVIVLSVGFLTLYNLNNTADKMVANFDGLEDTIVAGNWQEAHTGIKKVQELWNANKGWWAIVLDHQEIDNIEMALTRVDKYVSMQDRALASGELAVLRQMIEHIPDKERVNLKNIL